MIIYIIADERNNGQYGGVVRPPETPEADGGGGGGGGGHGGRGRGKRGPSKRGRKKAGEGRGGGGGGPVTVPGVASVGSTGVSDMTQPMDEGDLEGEYKLPAPPPEPMINIGSMSVKGSILDDVLSEKKCQLLENPEILEFLRVHCSNNS